MKYYLIEKIFTYRRYKLRRVELYTIVENGGFYEIVRSIRRIIQYSPASKPIILSERKSLELIDRGFVYNMYSAKYGTKEIAEEFIRQHLLPAVNRFNIINL